MQYRTLGKTGLKISALGFGGIPIQRIDPEKTKILMHQMMEAGVNYIDTARGYTVSEEYLGYALEGIRDHFILATKSMSRDKAGMARDIDISLKNFRTDYIDLYQFHNPNAAQLEQILAPGGAMEAMLEAKAAGKIGHIGVTLHSLDVFKQVVELDWVESVMFPYNIVETQGEELIARCKEQNIGFIAMKPLAGGAIEDGSIAVRYICSNPNVTAVIPGMYDLKEIDQNFEAASNEAPLTEEEQAKIAEVKKQLSGNFCRRCNYCAPCTVGINIPGVFLFQGYLDRYGLGAWAKDRYSAMAVKAGACVGCGVCETRCPYNLPIRDMLKVAAEKFGE